MTGDLTVIKGICAKCEKNTSTRTEGRYGRFLHVRCFDAWWRSEYGDPGVDPYYRWMRQGMCVR